MAVLSLVTVACGSTPTPALPSQSSPPHGLCALADLATTAGRLQGAGGQIVGFLVLANSSDRPCALLGFPELEIAADGVVVGEPRQASEAPRPVLLPALGPPPMAEGARRGQATVRFLFGNWCRPQPPAELVIKLGLPESSERATLRAPLVSPPRCDDPGAPPSLSVWPFEVVEP
ncbi:MAG TPA: DUF4232 domain-containing protein [Candidatus Limnocylindrales bacterium]|nr:DUF4232 domain-containing protein [Candidatus Limnocylindrales bacterium]